MGMIEIENVRKIYKMGDNEVRALDGVDLTIEKGELAAIMGPSGSGKSTLLAILGCLDSPTSGTYKLDGLSVERMSDNQLADVRNKKIGFVFQQFMLLARTSALENVMLPLTYAGRTGKQRRTLAEEALEKVGLQDRMRNKPNELSGGQMQRVAIARALVNKPAILLADEPTGALDSKTGVDIMNLFKQLHDEDGQTVIIVTHDPAVARQTKRIIRIGDGKIVGDGPVEDALAYGATANGLHTEDLAIQTPAAQHP
jgi:putative ABC transport system ATP-binding protein